MPPFNQANQNNYKETFRDRTFWVEVSFFKAFDSNSEEESSPDSSNTQQVDQTNSSQNEILIDGSSGLSEINLTEMSVPNWILKAVEILGPRLLSISDSETGRISPTNNNSNNSSTSWLNSLSQGLKIYFQKSSFFHYDLNEEKSLVLQPFLDNLVRNGIVSIVKRSMLKSLCPIGLAPKRDNKWRFIYDCRNLNKSSPFNTKTSFISARKIEGFLANKTWTASVDLSNAYWTIPLSEDTAPFFGFKFQGNYYHWNRMPFGWNGAPAVFQKALTISLLDFPFKNRVRHYFDDLLVAGDSYKETYLLFKRLISHLQSKGWKINEKKCEKPSRFINYLGFKWDLINKVIKPSDKSLPLLNSLNPNLTELEIFGVLNFYSFCSENLMIQIQIIRLKWQHLTFLQKTKILEELKNKLFRGRKIQKNFKFKKSKSIFIDATKSSYGWVCGLKVGGSLKLKEIDIASSELRAIYLSLLENSFSPFTRVNVFTDNSNVFHWLSKGYTHARGILKNQIYRGKLLENIFRYFRDNKLNLKVNLIKSEENPADWFSRNEINTTLKRNQGI